MDDALIEDWRGGQLRATTAVRNAVRTTAERVLSHPQLLANAGPTASSRLGSEEQRREVTNAVAQEVMSRKVETAAQLSALVRMVAARHAIVALQEGHPSGDAAHLPPQVAVTYALAPGGLLPRVRDAAARHLERSAHCANDQRIVKAIIASLEAPVALESSSASMPDRDPGVDGRFEAAAADRSANRSRKRTPSAASRQNTARVLPEPEPEQRRSWMVVAVPTLLLVVGGVWLAAQGEGPVLTAARNPALAELADRSAPDVGRLRDLPGEVQFAVADLAAGDCRTAAGRMRSARSHQPEAGRLYVLEAASHICAGDGKKALAVFSNLDGMLEGRAPPKASHWYRAQAHLLRGEATPALEALGNAVTHDPKHRKEADRQRAAIQAILEG